MSAVGDLKILITGTMGAGKTTAIAAVSDIKPLNTDVANNDVSVSKALTTVGMDYGELALGGGEVLRIYGTPGQERYSFMWQVLVKGAMGLVILIDNSRPDPIADLEMYMRAFSDFVSTSPCVVGVGRTETHATPELDQFSDALSRMNVQCPVVAVDVRQKEQVVQLFDLLLVQIEE